MNGVQENSGAVDRAWTMAPAAEDAGHDHGALSGDEMLVDERTLGRTLAGDSGLLLDRDRQTLERTWRGPANKVSLLRSSRGIQRLLETADAEGIDLRLGLVRSGDDRLHQLNW